MATQGVTTHIFKAMEITNKMMHNAPMMTLTCIMKRACFFSFGRVIIMALNIVLFEPEIPANTGNIGRTCVATNTRLHLIEPLGFRLNEKNLKRAGMDYWKDLDSPELIWAKYFVVTEDIDKAQLYYTLEYYNGWTSMQPTQALMIDYEMNNGKKFFEPGSGYDPKKPFANRDPRFYDSIETPFSIFGTTEDGTYNEYELQMYYLYKNVTIADFEKGKAAPDHTSITKDLVNEATHAGLGCHKWYDPLKPITDKQTITPFYPWFRLGEFYLNYAEAAYMCGKEDICREYINKVRRRAGMPDVTESGESLWDRVVNERRIELAFEFTRYFDVRRWMVADFYENIPVAGMRTMRLENNGNVETIYRMARVYDESKNNTKYYWNTSSEHANYVEANFGRDLNTVVTYKWLGKEYTVDYGDCALTITPTQKYFPADGRNYLMPIPQDEITKSKGSLVQNPHYDEAIPTAKVDIKFPTFEVK